MLAIIQINLTKTVQAALMLRYTLVDTIKRRGIGIVVSEEANNEKMNIKVEIKNKAKFDKNVKSILKALGLLDLSEIIYLK